MTLASGEIFASDKVCLVVVETEFLLTTAVENGPIETQITENPLIALVHARASIPPEIKPPPLRFKRPKKPISILHLA